MGLIILNGVSMIYINFGRGGCTPTRIAPSRISSARRKRGGGGGGG